MRSIPSTLLAAALLLGSTGCSDDSADVASATSPSGRALWKPPAPVNVVLIVIDTLRADAVLDPEGHYDTPNLDRLARDGIVFPRAFAAAPMTLPSHMSLFSSRPPFETKVVNNGQNVPEELPLLAEWLDEHGYETRAVISLGTLDPPESGPGASRGFERFDNDYWCMADAEDTTRRLVASLRERDRDDPLFLFAHYCDPHEPYNAHGTERSTVQLLMDGEPLDELTTSDESMWSRTVELSEGRTVFEFSPTKRPAGRFKVRKFEVWEDGEKLDVAWENESKPMDPVRGARLAVDRGERPGASCEIKVWINDVPPSDDSRRSRYELEVAFADRHVGELLAELEREGLYRDSLIVFTSDHGEAMGERRPGKDGRVHTTFGHAENLTDEQIHVPLIVKLPASDPRSAELAAVAPRLTTHLDLTPTILELVGLPPLPGQRGTSLLEPHEAVHIAQAHRPEAKRNKVALRDERFKMIFFPDEERFVLHDLEQDPGELTDVFATRSAERADWPERLRSIFRQSQAGFGDQGTPEEQAEREQMLEALGYGGTNSEEEEEEKE